MKSKMLLDLVSMTGKHARNVMIGLQQSLMPTWVYVHPGAHGKEVSIVATPWKNDAEKELLANRVRRAMRRNKAIAYSLVTEAWTAKAPAGWDPETGEPIRVREQPDRQEIVIGFATDGQTVEWRKWAIRRNHLEQVIALEEESWGDGQADSWMTTLLRK